MSTKNSPPPRTPYSDIVATRKAKRLLDAMFQLSEICRRVEKEASDNGDDGELQTFIDAIGVATHACLNIVYFDVQGYTHRYIRADDAPPGPDEQPTLGLA